MKHVWILFALIVLNGCGMTVEEKARLAAVTCAEIEETRGMDGAPRVRLFNEAREAIGEVPYLEGDEEIKRSIMWGTCDLLALNDPNYESRTNAAEDAYAAEEARKAEKAAQLAAKEAEMREQEYKKKRSKFETDSLLICGLISIKDLNIAIEEVGGSRVSDEQRFRTYDSEFIERGVDAGLARITSQLVYMRNQLDQAKKDGSTLTRILRCYDEKLPMSCEDIVQTVVARDYRPEKVLAQNQVLKDLDQCQIL